MTEISFYQLKRHSIEKALLRLLEKVLDKNENAVVRVGSEEELLNLDTALWTVDQDSFLPHGTEKSKNPEAQPVFLTTGTEAPNNASFCFVLPGASKEALDGFQRVIMLFDGARENQVKKARENWTEFKEKGFDLTYWTQNAKGGWEKG